MFSLSAQKYFSNEVKSDSLRIIATGKHVRQDAKQHLYQASLASFVSFWDAYIKGIINEFFLITPGTSLSHGQYISIATRWATERLKKFNTPNWENTRDLLIHCINFDPYTYWLWKPNFNSRISVQSRLNEILHVRHSFAHGFSIPNYAWLSSWGGKSRLNSGIIIGVRSFFRHLVLKTDFGLKGWIQKAHGIRRPW